MCWLDKSSVAAPRDDNDDDAGCGWLGGADKDAKEGKKNVTYLHVIPFFRG